MYIYHIARESLFPPPPPPPQLKSLGERVEIAASGLVDLDVGGGEIRGYECSEKWMIRRKRSPRWLLDPNLIGNITTPKELRAVCNYTE